MFNNPPSIITSALVVLGPQRTNVPAFLLSGAVALGGLVHLASISGLICFGLAAGMRGFAVKTLYLLVPVAQGANFIPGAPGGVGQGETAFQWLFERTSSEEFSVGNGAAGLLIMLCFRLVVIPLGLVGGVLLLLGRTKIHPAQQTDGGAEIDRHLSNPIPGVDPG